MRFIKSVFIVTVTELAAIAAADLPAGYHTIQWVPANLASGAYIVLLEAHGRVSAGRDARLIRKVSLVR